MREGQWYSELRRVELKLTRAYQQILFIDMRMQAFETVMFRPFSSLVFLFFPSTIQRRVDALQLELMQKHSEDMLKREKEKASKIDIIPAGAMNGQ